MSDSLKKFPWQNAVLPCFAVVALLALLFKLPNGLMDMFLSFNLALSAILFLTTFFIEKPLDFSAFPTLLLVTTLFRLVLNVSTTRLILTQGNAGQVIDAFSRFVAGDNIVVGAVIFLIFIVIQFVVITKGATRISEVSARFALDSLPGRQSAIDFDLNSGAITEKEAKRLRAELTEESDFYGAMDGASKFVRGDAIAGLVIVFVNIIGGLAIGVAQRGLPIVDAANVYSKLTIGDGLVSQIPAFLISLATGLLVARSSRAQNVSSAALGQTFGRPAALVATGAFLILLAFTGLPRLPLLVLASGCFALAWAVAKKRASAPTEDARETEDSDRQKKNDEEDVDQYLNVDPASLEIGRGLIALAQPDEGPTLLDRVKRVRQQIAAELGVVLPKTRVRDDSQLDDNQFSVKIEGEEVALGVVYPQMVLAVEGEYVVDRVRGLQTIAPSLGKPAYWIDPADADAASEAGYEIWTPGDVVEKKLLEVVRREAAALLTRDATRRLVERWKDAAPALVDEILRADGENRKEATGRLARTQRVLQLLLNEGVSIRRLDVVLEGLSDLELREPNVDVYRALEFVRARLSRTISAQYKDVDGVLRVAMLEPEAEDALQRALVQTESKESALAIAPSALTALTSAVQDAMTALRDAETKPVLLVDRAIRRPLRQALTSSVQTDLAVLAFDEIDPAVNVSQEVVVAWKPDKNDEI